MDPVFPVFLHNLLELSLYAANLFQHLPLLINAFREKSVRVMKQLCRVVRLLPVVALLSCFLPAFAQSPEPRLKGTIADTARVVLSNSRTPRVRTAQDLGAVSPDMAVLGITLVFKRSVAQEAALQELLTAQLNTGSPLYHQWLTPESFAARFGVADEDIAATESWLVSQGFHVERVARSRDRISFSGTAAQVQGAFGTELHHYRAEGELHFAPASDLTLPAGLASVTGAVLHLSDFRPKPNVKVQTRPRPDYTSAATQAHYLTPADIETMYDLKPLASNSFNGAGQELAVVGQSYVYTTNASVSTFGTFFETLDQIDAVLVPGTGVEAISPADEVESEVDLEYSSAIATQANIFLVYVGNNQNNNVFDALAYAITENIAPVVSISYGFCEPSMSQSELEQDNALYEEASAQGQTLVAAAGDSGSTSCAYYGSADGITPAQEQALSVEFPASSPNVTAVGGTQMAAGTFASGTSSYWANASITDLTDSLLSYVPEVVWNEDSATNGISAGGGGTSAYFPRPGWQSGVPGISSGAYRLLPDLSLQSSIASPGYLLCLDEPTLQGEPASSCVNGFQDSNGQHTTAGGTSFATPIFAGFLAILNQVQQEAGQGNINPVLYGLAGNPTTYATAFHDITSGTNACLASAATCSVAGESSYTATAGYDEATGLGSVDFNALTTAWPSSSHTDLQPTYVTLEPTNSVSTPGANDLISITVVAGYGRFANQQTNTTIPTGTVSVFVDGVVVNPSLALPTYSTINLNGSYLLTTPTATGSHLISVTYLGDATHSPSTATTVVNVGNSLASGGISLTAGNLTVVNSGTGSTPVTVTPSGGYTGTVAWSLAFSGGSNNMTACYGIASLPINSASTTQLTIGVGSACNSPSSADRGNLRTLGQRASASKWSQTNPRSATATAAYAGLLICGLFAGRRRRIRLSLLLAIVFLTAAGMGLTGCGGGGGGNNAGTSPTPPSSATNYIVTLTGRDSVNTSITASTTFTLTVN
jgi:subtilase family serine protease